MNTDKAQCIELILPALQDLMRECHLCGRHCGIDRTKNEQGFCRTVTEAPDRVRVSSHTLHFGEEPMLVGKGGSGTVFFTHCNLRCVFCQNYQISQLGMGREIDSSELAAIFLDLQEQGAENINLVTPTHCIYPILLALAEAHRHGLDRPLVYNTNGYDSVELLRLLDGIVDIYLPDMKYMDPAPAMKYSSGKDYPDVAKAAIVEMYRQVGPVRFSGNAAVRGLIIRHLVLPNNFANSYDFLLWLKDEQMTEVTLSIMSQYSPQHRATEFDELNATVSHNEYRDIVQYALDLGFENVLAQGLDSSEVYLPDFRNEKPFK